MIPRNGGLFAPIYRLRERRGTEREASIILGKKFFHRIQQQYPKNDPRVILESKKQITAQDRKVDRDMAPLLMKRLGKLKQHRALQPE